jgi:tetratricopeptide (TPR) repeat protein
MERPEGPAARVAGAAAAVWFYLAKALLPTRLSMIYPRWQIDPASVAWWLPAAGLAAAVVTLWILRRRIGRGAAFAVGASVVTLFPVLGLFTTHFHRYSLVADHWQYVSIVAPIALVVSAGAWVVGTMRNGKPVGLVLGGIAVVGLGAMTWQRQAAFADKRAMWADVLEKNPACWIAWYGTGKDRDRRGDAAGAAEAYRRCIAINGEFDQAHNNLGVILFSAGRYELAMHHFRAALLARPTNERAQENLRETQRRYRQAAMDRPSG